MSLIKPLLTAENICVQRQGTNILKDVSLEIAAHDFVTVIGPNGAGKSMLMKALMGFYRPDHGRIYRSKDVGIGYVPQRLSADVTIPLKVKAFLRLNQKISAAHLQQVAEECQIAPFLSKPLYVLSGGELQRVLLARALLREPDLLVLDEPAQNLDVSGQLAFYRLIDKIYQSRKIAILMVSHDLHLVMASTKKVICLFRHVCCSGTPEIVTQHPEFKALFGEDMAQMMGFYQHQHDHNHSVSGTVSGGCSHHHE